MVSFLGWPDPNTWKCSRAKKTFIAIFFLYGVFLQRQRLVNSVFALDRPKCITIQDGVAIDELVN